MHQKEEILKGLEKSCQEICEWVAEQADEKFVQGPEGKWETCQHIDHLNLSAKQIITGLGAPKMVLKMQFGKPNRPGRNYDALVERYHEKLAANDLSKNPVAGAKFGIEEKTKVLQDFKSSVDKMRKKLDKWKEEDLDKYLLPHPLLGKLTVRELMLWCVYHHYHHLKTLKDSYV